MFNDIHDCYRLLELEMGASRAEIKRAYRELVQVWHPDRFSHDPVLQRKAEEKLKQINLAYEKIGNISVEEIPPRTGAAKPPYGSTEGDARSARANDTATSSTSHQDGSHGQTPPFQQSESDWAQSFVRFAVIVVVLMVLASVFQSGKPTSNGRTAYGLPDTKQTSIESNSVPNSKHDNRAKDNSVEFASSKPPDIGKPTYGLPDTKQTSIESNSVPNPKQDNRAEDNSVEFATAKTPNSHPPAVIALGLGFFTIGSTKDEVLAVQGTPESIIGEAFSYGYSRINFANGRVKGWSDISKVLKIKMLPTSEVQPKGYFSIGSTKDEVLVEQGTPESIIGEAFSYGYSRVNFADGRVKNWSDISKVLKVKLIKSGD